LCPGCSGDFTSPSHGRRCRRRGTAAWRCKIAATIRPWLRLGRAVTSVVRSLLGCGRTAL
jgi:hypothetical protein